MNFDRLKYFNVDVEGGNGIQNIQNLYTKKVLAGMCNQKKFCVLFSLSLSLTLTSISLLVILTEPVLGSAIRHSVNTGGAGNDSLLVVIMRVLIVLIVM